MKRFAYSRVKCSLQGATTSQQECCADALTHHARSLACWAQSLPRGPRYTPHAGMGMFGLSQVQLYWERALDTKARPARRP